jgi:hypothetical protein
MSTFGKFERKDGQDKPGSARMLRALYEMEQREFDILRSFLKGRNETMEMAQTLGDGLRPEDHALLQKQLENVRQQLKNIEIEVETEDIEDFAVQFGEELLEREGEDA